jgi:hypothetical protein
MAEKTSESKPAAPGEVQTNGASPTSPTKRPKPAMWIIGAIAVALVGLLVYGRGNKTQNAQSSAAATPAVAGDLTLQTADRNELDCLADKAFQNYQCGAVDEQQLRQVDEKLKLRPFMTTDRQLYLIPGLFLEPAINQRFNAELPDKPRDQLKRFTAKCKITTIGELDNVKLRWSPSGPWEPPKKFPVATVSGCTIEG